jgi:hypothetical protein
MRRTTLRSTLSVLGLGTMFRSALRVLECETTFRFTVKALDNLEVEFKCVRAWGQRSDRL